MITSTKVVHKYLITKIIIILPVIGVFDRTRVVISGRQKIKQEREKRSDYFMLIIIAVLFFVISQTKSFPWVNSFVVKSFVLTPSSSFEMSLFTSKLVNRIR